MKYTITLESSGTQASGILLHRIAGTLLEMQIDPESFIWTAFAGGPEVRLWMLVSCPKDGLRGLMARLTATDGVGKVWVVKE